MSDAIRLGQKVKDKVSGLEGIVTSRCDPLTGAVQYGVQPMGKGDEMKEAVFIDHFTLQVKGDGVSADCPPVDSTVTVRLQDTVQDRITGFKGVALERVTFLNGCVYFLVQPETPTAGDRKGRLPERVSFAHARLDVLKAANAKPAAATVSPARTGGPNRSVRAAMGAR